MPTSTKDRSNCHNEQLIHLFTQQKTDFNQSPLLSLQQRLQQLKALKSAVLKHKAELVQAMSEDFGHRSKTDSLIGDIFPVISQINYTIKNLKKWMKPSKRKAGLLLTPAKIIVEYQPKGVVGIVAPWNFPIMLSLSPLVTSIAAGNRAMIKVSEFTPATNTILSSLIGSVFSTNQVAIVEGDVDVATSFTALNFDHLFFTGSTTVGKHVMRAAANNLTPVTLELGGKSPVIVADDISIETAVERIIYGKCLNAGQICVSPDYVLCPLDKMEQFIQAYQNKFQILYPDFANNDDYSQIINTKQAQRLSTLLQDAMNKGAKVYSADTMGECDTGEILTTLDNKDSTDITSHSQSYLNKKWPTQILVNVNDDMHIMQQEVFGPLLPIIGYQSLAEAIDYVNSHPRPLALYLMSYDKNTQAQVLQKTHSGGVCINDTVFHVAAEDAPFGGIGDSGMGHYHGVEGFKTMSHAKTVLQRGQFNSGKFIQPPYNKLIQKLILAFFIR
ncbi:coniferyl aldehyde dehydrogenase [Vibrio sp. MA40-2]|uniref:coniferyl aldehyde dehydrogenase n=1 Tax=Vibrio sp. MA40-2 TaxID=3391828 RepID=UPI0039A46F5F